MGFNTSLGLAGSYSVAPSAIPFASDQNYIDFTSSSTAGWAQQYLPELYEQEVERYGNRTIGGFLSMVGAEMPMESDQVIWSEQNRLHIAYKHSSTTGKHVQATAVTTNGGSINIGEQLNCSIRKGNTLIMTDAATGLKTLKCYVSDIHFGTTDGSADSSGSSSHVIDVEPYTQQDIGGSSSGEVAFSADENVNVFVYGSEWAKGSSDFSGVGGTSDSGKGLKPEFTQYDNRPVIIKEHFQIDGSDTAQIGWVETTDESGSVGYSWYLKSASETRMRFEDYLESMMIESELVEASSGASGETDINGSEGLFAAVTSRGNVFENLATLSDFDAVLQNLDKQGSIEENMLYVNRALALTIDDMVAMQNGSAQGGLPAANGASWGVFNNDATMALNFGFSGFRRGSYDFYKSDWKYLNDAAARGGFGDVSGILVPAGTSTVYDQNMGKNVRRPFLHVRYRKSATDDRKMKSWVTGSVGARTIADDVMNVHYLSERCLVTQAANNFVLLKEA